MTDFQMTVPQTLNGHTVIESRVHRMCATVMVWRNSDLHPYVVATWMPGMGSEWSWGHYCSNAADAAQEFRAACVRNQKRA